MVEPAEIESLRASGETDDAGLVGMQPQPEASQHVCDPTVSLDGSLAGRAQDHEVVGVSHEHTQSAALLPGAIQHVERDVGQQRRDRRSLRRARGDLVHAVVLEHPGSQPPAQQLQHPPIRHASSDLAHQRVVIDRTEAVRHVGVEHPVVTVVRGPPNDLTGLDRRPLGPEPETASQEVGLEDRFEDQLRRRHDHPISDRRDTKRPGLTRPARLGDVHPPQRRRPVRARLQPLRQVIEEHADPTRLDSIDRDTIDTRCTPLGTHVAPRTPQDVAAGDVAVHRVETTTGIRLGTAIQHALQSTRGIQTIGLSDGPSPKGTHQLASLTTTCTDEAGALRSSRVVLSRPSPLLRPPPTPSRPPATSRVTVIGRHASRPTDGAEEGLSSSQDNLLTVPHPLRRRVPRRPLQDQRRLPWPSPLCDRLGTLLAVLTDGMHHDAAGFASCCGPVSRHALHDVSSFRFDARLSTNAGNQLPGTLASPRTGLTPAGHPELVARLRHPTASTSFTSSDVRPSSWTHHTDASSMPDTASSQY